MKTGFEKSIYTIDSFRDAVDDALGHLDDFRAAHRSGRVDRVFAERIMLAVTRVNDCRYCSYAHTRVASAAGVPAADIQDLLAGDMGRLPEGELVALTFAQHYAESNGNPDAGAVKRLEEVYGPDTARDIVSHCRMITMGNLLGNTFDALLSRLIFRPAEGSSLWQELGVLLGAMVLVPAGLIRRKLHSAGQASL